MSYYLQLISYDGAKYVGPFSCAEEPAEINRKLLPNKRGFVMMDRGRVPFNKLHTVISPEDYRDGRG